MNFWVLLLVIIIFIIWAPFLVPFGLTINEELFVFLSFILFLELLGRSLIGAIAISADSRRSSASLTIAAALRRELNSITALRHVLSRIIALTTFRSILVANSAIEIFRLSQQPLLDQCFLLSQAFYRNYTITLRLECRFIRSIAQLALVMGLRSLRERLLNLPLLQPTLFPLTMGDFISITNLGLHPHLADSYIYYDF